MAEYMTIENNIITGIFCGDTYDNKNIIILPENHEVRCGETLEYYNQGFTRKSQVELIRLGLEKCPEGYILDGENIREMDFEERILAGLEKLPPYYKIKNNKVVEMEEYEKLETMTYKEKEIYHRQKRDNLIKQEIWKIERHNQEKLLGLNTSLNDIEFINLLKYIQELRDITKQVYFPNFVDYPDRPS